MKIKQANAPDVRVGFVVGKKVSSKSSARNQVKRRMRSAMNEFLCNMKKSADIVVTALPQIKDKTFVEIRGELERVLKQGGML